MVGKAGLEPARCYQHMILNHARLPFRHFPTEQPIEDTGYSGTLSSPL
jgi:hypothetical protein